jgi:hypothetical protein
VGQRLVARALGILLVTKLPDVVKGAVASKATDAGGPKALAEGAASTVSKVAGEAGGLLTGPR